MEKRKNHIMINLFICVLFIMGTTFFGNCKTVFANQAESTDEVNGNIKTLIGTGTRGNMNGGIHNARFTMPGNMFFGKNGEVYITDTYSNLIRVFNLESENVNTVSGKSGTLDMWGLPKGGYVDSSTEGSKFNRPSDGLFNSVGEMFIADSKNHVIRFEKEGNIYTFAGTKAGYMDGGRKEAMFNTPMAIAMDSSDNIYVADTLNHCIRLVTPKGDVSTIAGVGGSSGYNDGNALQALFNAPSGIDVSSDGKIIYVSDTGNHCIRKIQNGAVETIAGSVRETDDDGEPLGDYKNGTASEAKFYLPKGIDVYKNIIFVADSGNHRVRAIFPSGKVVTIAGNDDPGDGTGKSIASVLNTPVGVGCYNDKIYIADSLNNKIKVLTLDSSFFKNTEGVGSR